MAESIIFNLPEEVRPEHIEKYVVPVKADGSVCLDGIYFRAHQGQEEVTTGYYISTLGTGSTSPATGSSFTATITVTSPITVGDTLFIVALFGSIDGAIPAFLNNGPVTDSKGGSWSAVPNNGHVVGAINEETSLWTLEMMGWSSRSIVPGGSDLQIGDTVTIPWHTADSTQNKYSMFMLLEYANLDWSTMINQNGSPTFSNGEDYPDGSGQTDTTLSWLSDSFALPASPDNPAYMITLAGSYPANTTYTPAIGNVKTRFDDTASLVVTEEINVASGDIVEPGGTWGTSATLLVGNYQFMQKLA